MNEFGLVIWGWEMKARRGGVVFGEICSAYFPEPA